MKKHIDAQSQAAIPGGPHCRSMGTFCESHSVGKGLSGFRASVLPHGFESLPKAEEKTQQTVDHIFCIILDSVPMVHGTNTH